MKRWIVLLLLLALAPVAAMAGEAQPPAALAALCAEEYHGYTVSAIDGFDADTRGQYALVLSKDGHNVLCVAEKAADGTYALTVENDAAVRQGAEIPSLLIDTGGDALFYTYQDADATRRYHAAKTETGWGNVDVLILTPGIRQHETTAAYADGSLWIETAVYDENENFLSGQALAPLYAPWQAGRWQLADFDLGFWPDGNPYALYEQAALAVLPEGSAVKQATLTPTALMAEAVYPDGTRAAVLIEAGAAGAPRVTISAPLPAGVWLDFGHSWRDLDLRVYPDAAAKEISVACSFARHTDGLWYLNAADAPGGVYLRYTVFGVIAPDNVWYLGDGPAYELTTLDWAAIPASEADARAALDPSGWARVTSDDPANRLHLRAEPRTGAASLGKYYQGTPVRVLGVADGWAKVDVFGTQGYMMAKWLAVGDDMAGVENAYPILALRQDMLAEGLAVYAAPTDQQPAHMLYAADTASEPVVLGEAEGGWCHVLFLDLGLSGYIRQEALWAGNG